MLTNRAVEAYHIADGHVARPRAGWDREVLLHNDGAVTVFPPEDYDDGDSAVTVHTDGTVSVLGSGPVDLSEAIETGSWVIVPD